MANAYIGRFDIGFNKTGVSSGSPPDAAPEPVSTPAPVSEPAPAATPAPVSEPAPAATSVSESVPVSTPALVSESVQEPETDFDADNIHGAEIGHALELHVDSQVSSHVDSDDMQSEMMGASISEPAQTDLTSPAKRRVSNSVVTGDASSILSLNADKVSNCDVPKNLVSMVMRAVPAAKNRNDALSTFLYVAFNRTPVVSEKVEALAATCQIDSEVSNLQAQIDMLSKTLSRATSSIKAMDSALSQIMTMLVWLVGERANASIDLSQPAAAIDFMFAEQEFIRQRAESQTDEYVKYQAEMQARARYKASAAARDGRR